MENNTIDKEKLEQEKAQKDVQMIKDEELRRAREAFRGSSSYKFVMEILDSEIEKLDSISSLKLSTDDKANTTAMLAQQQTVASLKSLKQRIR